MADIPTGRLLSEISSLLRLSAPLEGAPAYAGRPNPILRAIAEEHARDMGLETPPMTRWVGVDPERSARIARAYDVMEHRPNDPLVHAAWTQMGDETLAQLQRLHDAGYRFDFNPRGSNPYRLPHDALADLEQNKHLWVFPTEEGFGTLRDTPENLLNRPVRGFAPVFGGAPFTYNDAFRVVHDALGHAPIGAGFRVGGEENAFQHHRGTFSDLANIGLTAETRGQNSWVNYGPFGARNRRAPQEDTIYADQKNGLMPDWVYNRDVQSPRRISKAELRRRLGAVTAILAGLMASQRREAA